MIRRLAALSAAALALAACQDYNFNPVGHCIVQPGSKQITLSNTNTADILFVVDDSNSMDPRQENLATNFSAFSNVLDQTNKDRVTKGLAPIEFHLAVTTSSVFRNYNNGGTCGSTTANECCDDNQVSNNPACHACTSWGGASGSCGDYSTSFQDATSSIWQGCKNPSNIAQPGAPYPRGDFVAKPGNPKVIHLTADLWTDPSKAPLLTKLINQFRENIYVGSCGSGEEQHLSGARMALEKMQGGQQPDIGNDEFLHKDAKLAVVWMGDEDDCSNPASGNERDDGIPLTPDATYWDNCIALENSANDPHIKVTDFFNFFNNIPGVSDFAAGFITSVADGSCKQDPNDNRTIMCDPGICHATSCPGAPAASSCDGVSPGNRFHALASLIHNANHQVVMGSICDSDFSSTLAAIAQIVIPVDAMTLDTVPAGMDIVQLRIIGTDGKTRKVCKGPAPGEPHDGYDWYFISGAGQTSASPTPTRYMVINHATGGCEANPGETYRVEYIGQVASCSTDHDCTVALGGSDTDWSCDSGQCHCKGQ